MKKKKLLQAFIDSLDINRERGPKYQEIVSYLVDKGCFGSGALSFPNTEIPSTAVKTTVNIGIS